MSWDFRKDDGVFTVEVNTAESYGYFEHNTFGDECGGGLWFEVSDESIDAGRKLELVDYDGVYEMPRRVVTILRDAGFIVSEDF